jgi:catechol 2,3-dioxygenase-like lactoylglutathione lyase family enzyme
MKARWCLLIFVFSAVVAAAPRRELAVTAVDAIGITVEDMDRSVEFFSKVLSFETVSDVEVWGTGYERLAGLFGVRARVVRMRLGEEFIELTEHLTPKGRPLPVDSRSHDRWFQHIAIIVSDMDKAYQWLRRHKVEHASTGPQRLPDWNENAAGIQAFYFKDPDNHPLEILAFPPGKGDGRWHRATGRLFLGIDHTAIVVDDTDTSLRFYRDALGMLEAGGSENYGNEQEHLNNVFGARLKITTLRAASGPGVELLEYLAPSDGRPYPNDVRASDLVYWQTIFSAPDVHGVEKILRFGRFTFVSPGVVDMDDRKAGFGRGLSARDPDGHATRFIQK